MALAQAVQGSAVSTHQTGNVRPDDLHAHLLFKGAEYRFIIEGTALATILRPSSSGWRRGSPCTVRS